MHRLLEHKAWIGLERWWDQVEANKLGGDRLYVMMQKWQFLAPKDLRQVQSFEEQTRTQNIFNCVQQLESCSSQTLYETSNCLNWPIAFWQGVRYSSSEEDITLDCFYLTNPKKIETSQPNQDRILESLSILRLLARKNTVILLWVQGHWRCEDKKVGGGLPKKAAQSRYIESILELEQFYDFIKTVKDWSKHVKICQDSKTEKVRKDLSTTRAKFLLTYNERYISVVTTSTKIFQKFKVQWSLCQVIVWHRVQLLTYV